MCGNFSSGAARPRDLKPTTPEARAILLSNVCGSFVGIEHPIYTLFELKRQPSCIGRRVFQIRATAHADTCRHGPAIG